MRTRLHHLWEIVSSGYWFLPMVLSVAATGTAVGLLYLDGNLLRAHPPPTWLYSGGPDGARTLLSTLAASVITVAGVVFSITVSTLTQASRQFGPRLLRNFMRDKGNQTVLGTFVATFFYCIFVLRSIHGDVANGDATFVPHASVTGGVVLAAASIAVLIYFIHHISSSLQAPIIVAGVRGELEEAIAALPRREPGDANGSEIEREQCSSEAAGATAPVLASHEGYLQVIDFDALVSAACEAEGTFYVEVRPGDYVFKDAVLLKVAPAERITSVDPDRVNGAFLCGRQATPEQDLEFSVRQIVEIAVRALSLGTNDPFTAINCIDALGSAVCELSRRKLAAPVHRDESGARRVVATTPTFQGIVDQCFNQIRQYGRTSVAVLIRLLEVVAVCAEQVSTRPEREALRRHAEMIYRQSKKTLWEREDRDDVHRRWTAVAEILKEGRDEMP